MCQLTLGNGKTGNQRHTWAIENDQKQFLRQAHSDVNIPLFALFRKLRQRDGVSGVFLASPGVGAVRKKGSEKITFADLSSFSTNMI